MRQSHSETVRQGECVGFAVKNIQSKILSDWRQQSANDLAESLNQLHSAIQDAERTWIRMDYAGMAAVGQRKSLTVFKLY